MSSPRRIRVTHPDGGYDVVVGVGAIADATPAIEDWSRGRKVFVVSSPTVRGLHGGRLSGLFRDADEVHDLEVPDGEEAKGLEVLGELWEAMLVSGGKRDSRLVALGGGSVGDVGGFAAACFLRGIEFLQMPTTLLAQVDASVGGKTAVDLAAGKNTVGAFHQPRMVVADTEVLTTLPDGEIRAGLVEAVKMGATLDVELFEAIESGADALLARDMGKLTEVVALSVDAKRRVVEEDPLEGDRRRLLNFGHTLGHALEAVIGYGSIRHGEAVAHGMRYALGLAVARGLDAEAAARIEGLIDRLEIPALGAVDVDALIEAMRRDKKARESGLAWVLPVALGDARVFEDVGWAETRAQLETFLAG